MSKKLKDFFWILLKTTAVIEVILGLIWIAFNITGFYEDSIAYNYIAASKTLVIDDYMGLGYAMLLGIFGHGTIMYLVQLLVLLAAFFPYDVTDKTRKINYIFADLFIVFNPLILQTAFTILPNALILAETVGIIRLLLHFYRVTDEIDVKGQAFNIIGIVLLEGALGLLNKDYSVLMLVFTFPIIIYGIIKKKRNAMNILALSLLACFLCININTTRTDVYHYGNVEKSFNYLMAQRLAFKHVNESSEMVEIYYDRDLYYEMLSGDKVPERLGRSFGRTLEKVGGKENTEAMYKVIADVAKSKGFGHYGYDIIKDVTYYAFAPFSTAGLYLTKKTETLIANPLSGFFSEVPLLSKVYLLFSEAMLLIVTLVSVVAGFAQLFDKNKIKDKRKIWYALFLLYMIIVETIYLSFCWVRGFNYMYATIIVAAWPLLNLLTFEGKEE
jgi:hypothetical protein